MPNTMYLWLLRPIQVQDTVFMNEFAQFLHKNCQSFHNLVLYLDTNTPEEIYFQAKRISGFLSEHLVANTVFHLHQWGLVGFQNNEHNLNSDKLSKVFALSSTVVFTNVWNENLFDIQKVMTLFQKIPVKKTFLFTNNPHLNIHTQVHEEILQFPDETETANLFAQLSLLTETWVSHINNLGKVI